MKQRFQIGDPVEVSSTYRYFDEWKDAPLWICGIRADLGTGLHSYEVSEAWPPKPGTTDGWAEADLSPRAQGVTAASESSSQEQVREKD